ncbi:MAG: tetratricopeptide repeat protein [bacterium]|nr:tetratricopeptide repeat protein [bacterium]
MKRWQNFLLVIIVVVFISVYTSRDSLALLVWQEYHLPQMAVLLDGNNAELAMSMGGYYFNSVNGGGEYNVEVAEKAYEKAVSINPGILWGHYQLARIHFVKGDFAGALEEINKELEANPENLRSLYIRGLIYGYRNEVGDLEKAEADFRRFTEWAPSEWAGYNDLAWVLLKEGKYADTEIELKRAFENISEGNMNPWLWNARGVAELNLRKYSRATNSFKRAKELAEKLTLEDWRRSYPGNNPATSGEGFSAFRRAIDENLRRAESKR